MKKNIFIFILMILAPVLWLAGGSEDVQAQTIELKMAHFMPPMQHSASAVFLTLAKKVEELTGGRVKIKIYTSETLGSARKLAEAVKNRHYGHCFCCAFLYARAFSQNIGP